VKENIALRYERLLDFFTDTASFGAIVGRYANRTADGHFELSGSSHYMPLNDGRNSLHGGPGGFAQKVWSPSSVPNGIEFLLVSLADEWDFPEPSRLDVLILFETIRCGSTFMPS
jgi:aldose 1-epimerase